ncbi:E3 ubiquitin-protein ligase ZFP91-like isoform X2 [Sinocyclocheilus anshuiensis]|uniref:E3 ubiquitin-protein ligase ZFP91-like isoform X2 n=1 Tax=Sinocyclocheilus anshuiensis TaxID=1608454 RepID=UPI0007B90204|nr:PREDICTED: E3 ubiquitin-protein ligase ZFP91-like isoform X2 [Sinocyclocheilus anshuiensis]
MEPQLSNNKEEVENETAMEKSAGQSTASTPCRAFRGRGDGCLKTEVICPPETNGAATSVAGSGRVLRDRSTRTIPVWRQSDIGEDRDEVTRDAAANRRRKAKCPRRRKSAAAAAGSSDAGKECGGDCYLPDEFEENKDALVNRAARGRRVQVHSGARTCRGSPRTVFKIEPEMDIDYVEANKAVEKTGTSVEKKEEESMDDEVVVEEEESQFLDDPKDENYLPHSHSEEEDIISSDEDVPFRDDLNDQSYDPKDFPKSRRRPPTRLKEKKDKAAVPETATEQETEIKTEGGESTDVQTAAEVEEGAEPPRKGRRKKDDKSPRLPKRRKKPPVQYVRCEMEGCGTVLAHPRYLQHHIKYQHLMKKKYVCPHPSCGRLFRLQKQLLRHAKHHTDQRDYICEFCARAFKSSHNLAVHRMIHTGEKPLQCEICGFTCRQKASLNWHMKKHDADATYQFSCSICGKKFEKKDSVVAHKAKSHPEVLIAEALAANAGALITTPAGVTTLLETSTGFMQTEQVVPEAQGSSAIPADQVAPVTHVGPVMVVDQDHPLHTMQVPVTLALSSTEEENSAPSQQTSAHSLQMPLQFVSTPVSQQHHIQQLPIQPSTTSITQQAALVQQLPIQSYSPQSQIVHMAFRALPQQQLPLVSVAEQLPLQTTQSHQNQTLPRPPSHNPAPNTSLLSQTLPADSRSVLGFGSDPASLSASPQSSTTPSETRQVVWEGDGTNENGNGGGVWEVGGEREEQNMTDSSDGQIQRVLM